MSQTKEISTAQHKRKLKVCNAGGDERPVLHPILKMKIDRGAHLLAGPEGSRLEDGGHGDLAIPVLQPHEDVHEQVLLDEGVALSNQAAAQQCVLHNANHRLVGLQFTASHHWKGTIAILDIPPTRTQSIPSTQTRTCTWLHQCFTKLYNDDATLMTTAAPFILE